MDKKKEVWKVIPDYEPYEASSLGNIRYGRKLLNYQTDYGYKRATLSKKFDVNIPAKISVHRTIAKTFIPTPENKPQVNHLDGNKANNSVSNLEWSTGKENVEHAFVTGLRTDNVYIDLVNIEDGTTQHFRSLTDLTKHLDLAMDTLISYIKRSQYYPMYGKYRVDITPESQERMLKGLKPFYKKIYVYDYLDSSMTEYVSVAHAAINTGVNTYTVREALGKKQIPVYYMGGYLFSYSEFKPDSMNIDVAKIDRDKMFSKPLVKIGNEIEVYDYDAKETKLFKTREEASDFILSKGYQCKDTLVTMAIARGRKKKVTGLLRGFGIKFKDDNFEWYNYTKRQLLNSKHGIDLNSIILGITENNVETLYYGLTRVAMKYNLIISTLRGRVKKGEEAVNAYFRENNIDATVVII